MKKPSNVAGLEPDAGPWSRWTGQRLPLLCQELYYRYCIHFSEEAFEGFYHSTLHIFKSFAAEKCAAAGLPLEPQEIVNRLYGVLIAHATSRRRLPIRALLSWCLGTICNMIREERRLRSRDPVSLNRLEDMPGERSPLDQIILREEGTWRSRLYASIRRLIREPNTALSDRERKVMDLFYFKGMSLRRIADHLGIKVEHAAVILFRTRRRIALLFRRSGITAPGLG